MAEARLSKYNRSPRMNCPVVVIREATRESTIMRGKIFVFVMFMMPFFSLAGVVALSGCGGSASSTQTQQKTTPTITWATPDSIYYGSALSSTQLDATANVAGTFTYSPSLGTMLNAGTQQLSAVFIPNDTSDYTTANASVPLLVLPKKTQITTLPKASPITYGQPITASTLMGGAAAVAGGAALPGTFSWAYPTDVPASWFDDFVTDEQVIFTPTDSNYGISAANVYFIVYPVNPTIAYDTLRYVVSDNFSNMLVNYTVSCGGCFVGDVLHDLNGFPDITLQSSLMTPTAWSGFLSPSGIVDINVSRTWNGTNYDPHFDNFEIQHPNGPFGNQWSTAFLGNTSQSTLAVSATTGTQFQVEQQSGQVYFTRTDGTAGTLFSAGQTAQSPSYVAADDVTGNLAYLSTGGNQITVLTQSGNQVCTLTPNMSFVSSIAAKGGYMAFSDPKDNLVGMAKMDCSGYQAISVPGAPWSVAIDGSGYAYVLSRDVCAYSSPCLTKIGISSASVVASLDIGFPMQPVSAIRGMAPNEGVYQVVAFGDAPFVEVLYMVDDTNDTSVFTISSSTMTVTHTTPIGLLLPYILAPQDGETPILRVGYINDGYVNIPGGSVTDIGDLDPTTGKFTSSTGACPNGLVGGLAANSKGVYCAGGSTISAPLNVP